MPSTRITFEVIENSGPNNLRDVLKAKFVKASEVCIDVAFVTELGLNEIISSLRQVTAAKGKVRFITGLYQHVTEPKALKILLRAQKETNGKCEIHLSHKSNFHRKLFLLENRTRSTAIIGSSNLTREGLVSGGELNLEASFSKNHLFYKRLKGAFEKDWNSFGSFPLTLEIIKWYEKVRRVPVFQNDFSKEQLNMLLKANFSSHKGAVTVQPVKPTWRDSIQGLVKKGTEKKIYEKTNCAVLGDGYRLIG